MTDDFSNSSENAYSFPLVQGANGLASGSLTGEIGPVDIDDIDWFKFNANKGANYKITLSGGDDLLA